MIQSLHRSGWLLPVALAAGVALGTCLGLTIANRDNEVTSPAITTTSAPSPRPTHSTSPNSGKSVTVRFAIEPPTASSQARIYIDQRRIHDLHKTFWLMSESVEFGLVVRVPGFQDFRERITVSEDRIVSVRLVPGE